MKSQAVKGTHDILPSQQGAWRHVLESSRGVFERAGVRQLTTPIFEYSEVFTKSVGESADLVVQKEMYSFEDRGGRDLTLRPEFTAGVLRAFIEHGMHTLPTPVKLWSAGPLFRAENVQRGRYRQFHQVNLEIVGLATPLADAECIQLLYRVLEACGVRDHRIKLGSVGDPEDRMTYNAYLREALGPHAAELSELGQARLRLNPMRLLDSKDPRDQERIQGLKRPYDLLGSDAREHLTAVAEQLTRAGIPYELDPSIVRGLDYHRRTAFEVHADGIGAQSALGGGGRYDGLIESLGGPPLPGVGWAFGIERVLDAIAQEAPRDASQTGPVLFLVPVDDEAVTEVATFASDLRRSLHVEHSYVRRNIGKGLKEADRSGAMFAGLRGSAERAAGTIQLKHLASGEQHEVAEAELGAWLEARITLIGSPS